MSPFFRLLESKWLLESITPEQRAAMLEDLRCHGEIASLAVQNFAKWISSKVNLQLENRNNEVGDQHSSKYDFAYDLRN